jgi:hypothetical protein|tara:strand:- start:53 stop:313 length:261 start_codon:yes stop_codon:yes gene_type:complete
MKNKFEFMNKDKKTPTSDPQTKGLSLLHIAGWLGVAIATPFFLWVPLGLTSLVPSMIDVFGIVGLRTPAAITIAGLLLASVGFHRI